MFRIALLLLIITSVSYSTEKKRMILFIGDGFGIAPKTATRMAMGQGRVGAKQILNLDKLRFSTSVTTHSLNSWITDSAPGASVYACGDSGKIDNEMISWHPISKQPIETILEKAKKNGYAVGIITNTRITHATPAAFGSHIWNRDLEDWIAAQLISKNQEEYEEVFNTSKLKEYQYNSERDWVFPYTKIGVDIDLLMGGGLDNFLPNDKEFNYNGKVKGKRKDGVNLVEIAQKRGFEFITNRNELLFKLEKRKYIPNRKILALFNSSHLRYEQDRQTEQNDEPMLAEMVEFATNFLESKCDKGYFLIVESGRIDHLEHANCGGISLNNDLKSYTISANQLALKPDKFSNKIIDTTKVFGSDYMIKEVLAYDYAIGKARELLTKNGQTFIITTSDHETGGFSVVGLSDSNNKIRTYAKEPSKKDFNPNPNGIIRADTITNGWFPNYILKEYQGYKYPESVGLGRIVVAYGSNPLTNGNKAVIGSTAGNHTPQDVLLNCDDNKDGYYSRKLTERGLLDNTEVNKVMLEFLDIK